MKILKLTNQHKEEYWDIIGSGPVGLGIKIRIKADLKSWLKENKIRYSTIWWRCEPYLLFLRSNDAVLFKITWCGSV